MISPATPPGIFTPVMPLKLAILVTERLLAATLPVEVTTSMGNSPTENPSIELNFF